jgi:hypothetical protein
MHTCKIIGCSNPTFGGGYCKYHQYKRSMQGGDLFKRKTKPKKAIPVESKKRKEEKKTYKQVKDELRAEMIANGTYNCFFCGLPMGGGKGFHHLKGREGQLYIDPKYLVPGHNLCHVEIYHRYTVDKLLRETWYAQFLSRLKAIEEKLYWDEMKKQDKGLLFTEED